MTGLKKFQNSTGSMFHEHEQKLKFMMESKNILSNVQELQ